MHTCVCVSVATAESLCQMVHAFLIRGTIIPWRFVFSPAVILNSFYFEEILSGHNVDKINRQSPPHLRQGPGAAHRASAHVTPTRPPLLTARRLPQAAARRSPSSAAFASTGDFYPLWPCRLSQPCLSRHFSPARAPPRRGAACRRGGSSVLSSGNGPRPAVVFRSADSL